MNKIKTFFEYIWEYRLLSLIIFLSIVAYFYTEHNNVTFTDAINIIIAIILGYITIKADQLVSSDEIRAAYCLTSSFCNNLYISEIILENKRNKPIAINSIHMQLGNNYAIKLIEYDEPLMLQPLCAIKVTLEPVTLYLIGCDRKVDLNKELKRNNQKTLIITSTDRFIRVKNFKKCPNFIDKVLREQPFAEIIPHREYWDKNHKEVKNENIRYCAKIIDTNGNHIDTVYIDYNNALSSYKISSIFLKSEDTKDIQTLEEKLYEVLPYKKEDINVEISENKISLYSQFKIEEKPLKYYNYLQTKILNFVYKIYLFIERIRLKRQEKIHSSNR